MALLCQRAGREQRLLSNAQWGKLQPGVQSVTHTGPEILYNHLSPKKTPQVWEEASGMEWEEEELTERKSRLLL